jgi:hypothetical protein
MKKAISIIVLIVAAVLFPIHAYAHSGGTDSKGGHYNRSTGEYHYHHGYSAHQHKDMDGDGKLDCPYEFDDSTNSVAVPQYTIDLDALEELKELSEKLSKEDDQPHRLPKEYNSQKPTLKASIVSDQKSNVQQSLITWIDIPVCIIVFSLFLLFMFPFVRLINENFAESMAVFAFKLILFSLPFMWLFSLF